MSGSAIRIAFWMFGASGSELPFTFKTFEVQGKRERERERDTAVQCSVVAFRVAGFGGLFARRSFLIEGPML